ncbi:hypothetical protein K1719_002698 [Acacia pycnantha]|nr:hypothetical protein K1719_002698 [Acacia pycnantha]
MKKTMRKTTTTTTTTTWDNYSEKFRNSGIREGIIVRRVIPLDNSCLFNAIGYVMDHDKTKASELRQVIAATVASDPQKYSVAFLGKPNADYCAWILDPEKWGGAIELSILAVNILPMVVHKQGISTETKAERRRCKIAKILVEKNFDMAFQVIYEFNLPAVDIYVGVAALLVERKRGSQLTEFFKNIKGTIDDDNWDQIFGTNDAYSKEEIDLV